MAEPGPGEQTSIESPDQSRGIVILGGAHGSLAVARSLGRRGIPVWLVSDRSHVACWSRYVARNLTWLGPEHPSALAFLLDLAAAERLEGWVLMAGGDADLRFVAQAHGTLSKAFAVASAPWDIARWVLDKRLTHELAESVGVHSPWSCHPADRSEVSRLAHAFPMILKPRTRMSRNAFTAAKAWRVEDSQQLLARYDRAVALAGAEAIAIQELVPGGGKAQFSYGAVWKDGKPVASLVARRSRQFPVDFGLTSTFVETIEQPAVEAAACRLLSHLGYSGLVEVEFKYDARDQRYKLLDINARPWTWLGLGTAAGLDLPYLAWTIALGKPAAGAKGRPGVAWTYASRDLAASTELMFRGALSPIAYLRSLLHPSAFAAFSADDPMPGLLDLPLSIVRLLRRHSGAVSSGRSALLRPQPSPGR